MSEDLKVFALFCDDVRQEAGNKHSLMGVYGTECVLSQIPGALPKLCVVVTILAQPGRKIETLSARMTGPDGNEQAFPIEFDPTQLQQANPDIPLQINLVLIGGAVQVNGPSKITISVKIDDEDIEAGALWFRQAREGEIT